MCSELDCTGVVVLSGSIMEGGGEKGARKMRVNAWSDHNDGPLHLPRETKIGRTTGS